VCQYYDGQEVFRATARNLKEAKEVLVRESGRKSPRFISVDGYGGYDVRDGDSEWQLRPVVEKKPVISAGQA